MCIPNRSTIHRSTGVFRPDGSSLPQADPAHAEKRVALVIGNSAYEGAGQLDNPVNDATDMAAVLKTHDFVVIDGFNLTKAEFDRRLRDFVTALSGAEVGLFFYAGHGLQISDQNYLVPVDARLSTPDAAQAELVSLDAVQATIRGLTRTRIIFLDACRNNPLAQKLESGLGTRSTGGSGQAQVRVGLAPMEGSAGTLISFSTQPGNVALDGAGRNSPFTAALVEHIARSRDDLGTMLLAVRRDVMRDTGNAQIPWEHSALTNKFFFDEDARVATLESMKYWKANSLGIGQTVSAITPEGRPLTCVGGNQATGTSRKCSYTAMGRPQLIETYEGWLEEQVVKLAAKKGSDRYGSASDPKAFAMCIDWKASSPGQYVVRHWGAAWKVGSEEMPEVLQKAMQKCKPDNSDRCRCQIVHENGKRVGDPPADWLAKFSAH
jgi:hypothetical protein